MIDVMPVTEEHKIYLEGIDEQEANDDEEQQDDEEVNV